jgi:hypothetical protein
MEEEWNAQEGLKIYLERVLSLRPAKNLSVMSFFIFKVGKELLDAISEDAGVIGDRERYLKYFYGLKLKRLPTEEGKVLDVVLEGIEWIKEGSTLWEWKSDEHKGGIPEGLHGDEIFWAFNLTMMTDKEIEESADPDPLARLKSIGVELKDEIEDLKWHSISEEDIKKTNAEAEARLSGLVLWEKLKKDAETAGSDFFDYVSDETLNIISDACDWLEDDFKEYLKYEKGLKAQVRILCPDTFTKKWKILLKVYLQAEESSDLKGVKYSEIPKLLPYVSDMRFLCDTLEIKINVFNPKLIYLFGNLGADEYSEEDGWYQAWWD